MAKIYLATKDEVDQIAQENQSIKTTVDTLQDTVDTQCIKKDDLSYCSDSDIDSLFGGGSGSTT